MTDCKLRKYENDCHFSEKTTSYGDYIKKPNQYQKRVIKEKHELDVKATKLSQFIGNNPLFEDINPVAQEAMKEQCEIMWEYSEILGKRIALFI